MKKILLLLPALLSLLTSCDVFEPSFEDPDRYEARTLEPTHTIAELCALYSTGSPMLIDEDIVIAGQVITTDRPGNFYKSFFIQDKTGGIELKLGKNGLYNDYKQGQWVYVKCMGMTLGMYGNKSGSGVGMIQLGFSDPTESYETSYMESPLFIDAHIIRGAVEPVPEPVLLTDKDFPSENSTQKNCPYIGKLVTLEGLRYGWMNDRYGEYNEAFALLYLDSTNNKKLSSNRIFVSGEDTGVTTWAMSKVKMTEYLHSGIWDHYSIGNAGDYNYGTVGDRRTVAEDGTVSYPGIEKAAASVSHYFTTPGGKGVQIRTSGFSKFADTEIDEDILYGTATLTVTGVLNLYQGSVQIVVNSIDDFKTVL